MDYVTMKVEAYGARVSVRAYMVAQEGTVIKAAVIVGPEQSCVGVFANMVGGECHVTVDGHTANTCDRRYRRLIHHLPCKWVAMLILSKDPRCLWEDSDSGLIEGIKRTTETPFLDSWIGHMRSRMLKQQYLVKLTGHNPKGSIIECDTAAMDAIVVDGIKKNLLRLE